MLLGCVTHVSVVLCSHGLVEALLDSGQLGWCQLAAALIKEAAVPLRQASQLFPHKCRQVQLCHRVIPQLRIHLRSTHKCLSIFFGHHLRMPGVPGTCSSLLHYTCVH